MTPQHPFLVVGIFYCLLCWNCTAFQHEWKMNLGSELVTVLMYHDETGKYDVEVNFPERLCDNPELDSQSLLLSRETVTDFLIRDHLGPDEMYVLVEGKSLLGLSLLLESCRKYKASFHVEQNGVYHVKINRIRSQYASVNERGDFFPMMHPEYVLSEWVELEGTANAQNDKIRHDSCQKSLPGGWSRISQLKNDTHSSLFDSFQSANETRPISVHGGKLDRVIPLESFVEIDRNQNVTGCVVTVDNYEWRPAAGCTWSTTNVEEASKLLSHKKILILGDSHSRELIQSFIHHWACKSGQGDFIYTQFLTKSEYRNDSIHCPGLLIEHKDGQFCDLIDPRDTSYDLVVANCGHHPASDDHWSLQKYSNTVTHMLIDAMKNNFTNRNLVWMESPPQPLRQDHWVIDSKDWRTLHRLTLFNDFSNRLFARHNFSVLYTFQPLLPFMECMCDAAHYIGPSVQQPVIQQFLQLLKERME